jgi:hypothetical protein
MPKQVSCCDNCHKPGRLHWCLPGDWSNEAGIKPLLLCDHCYESVTGLIPCCDDCCNLPLDHLGVCRQKIDAKELLHT